MTQQLRIAALVDGFTLADLVAQAEVLISEADVAKNSGCRVDETIYDTAIADRIDDVFRERAPGVSVITNRDYALLRKFNREFGSTSASINPNIVHEGNPSALDGSNERATFPKRKPVGAFADETRPEVPGIAGRGIRILIKFPLPSMPQLQPSSTNRRSSPHTINLPGIKFPCTILRIGSGGTFDDDEAEDTGFDFDLEGDGQDTEPEDASERDDADGMSESEFENEEQDVESDALSEQDGVSEADSDVEDDQSNGFEMHDAASEPFEGGGSITAAALIAESEAEDTDCVMRGGLPTPRASVTPEFEELSTALEHTRHFVVELRDAKAASDASGAIDTSDKCAPSASVIAPGTELETIKSSHAGNEANTTAPTSSSDDVSIQASDQEIHESPRIIIPVPVLEFPTETLLHILSYLRLAQILQYRSVCKHFKRLIDNKSNLPLLLAKQPLQTSMLDKLASTVHYDILQFDYLEILAELVARRGLWSNKDPYILNIHIMMDLFMRRGLQVNDAARAITWDAFWKLGYSIWQVHIQHHLAHQGLRCMNWMDCVDANEFVRRVYCPLLEAYGITQGTLTKWYNDLSKTPGGYLRCLSGPRSSTQAVRWGGPEISQFCLTGLYAFDSGISMRPTCVTLKAHYRPPIVEGASKRLAEVLGIAELPTQFEAYGQLFRDGYVFAWCARSRNVFEKVKEVLTEEGGKELTALEKAIIREDLYLV